MTPTRTALAFYREGRLTDADYDDVGGGYRFARVRPRIACVDGFDVSVQAGSLLYATPRTDEGPWSAVEVGFPSARPEPWDEWSQYAEEPDNPTETVYSYVPLTMVEALIASHGGEA
jgi:hypothetical protein